MRRAISRNAAVALAFWLGTALLVAVEVGSSTPPSNLWFYALVVVALGGFAWANYGAFSNLAPAPIRLITIGGVSTLAWLLALAVAIVAGMNLKFALGGGI